MVKTPLMTSTLKAGLCVSLALHAVLAVGVKYYWHTPARPRGGEERPMLITMIAEKETDAARSDFDSTPAPAPTPMPEPAPAPPPEPPPPLKPEPAPSPVLQPKPSEKAVAESTAPVAPAPSVPQPVKQLALATPMAPAAPASPASREPVAAPIGPASGAKAKAPPGIRATPVYRINPEPAYPASARRRRQEGLVILSVTVSAQGRALGVIVKNSSGFPVLDEAATQAVRGWEFEPARLGPQTFESDIEVPVRFKIAN